MVSIETEERNIILIAYKFIRDEIRNEIPPHYTIDLKAMINQFIWTTIFFAINMERSEEGSNDDLACSALEAFCYEQKLFIDGRDDC
jgi:hypothetical protein